jgi:ribosomal protein S18 acetylase RimI-like enzyme
MDKMRVETTKINHISSIVDCHEDAFPDALSTKQGRKFISKMLEWYIVSNRGVLFHIYDNDNQIVGYCGGIITKEPGLLGAVSSISQYAFQDFIKSYIARPWLLFHKENLRRYPYIIKNLLIRLGIKSKRKKVSAIEKSEFKAFMGLVVIGVRKQHHGKGFGSLLLQEFERLAKSDKNIHKIQLTVKSTNHKAIKSYLNNGWLLTQENLISKQFSKIL